MLCNALKWPLALQSSSQNLLLVWSLPVFRNRNERNLNLPYHRSSTTNRFAFREEGKSENKQLSLLIFSLASQELKLKLNKKDKLFFTQLFSSYLLGYEKIYPFLELVENKPHFLPPASKVCHAWRTSKPLQAVLLWKISKIKQSLVE